MTDPRVQTILAEVLRHEGAARGSTPLPLLLCCHAAHHLGVDGVGLWLMTSHGSQQLVAATDGLARNLEELQFISGEGPCLEAFHSHRPVAQPDLAAVGPARWPIYGPAALVAGAAAVFAIPLQLGGIRLGVLDLYRSTTGQLDDDGTAQALAYADAATILMIHLQGNTDDALDPQLEAGWTGRAEVHQATGMVSVQAGVGLAEALLLLRARAYADNRSTSAVAVDVLARTLTFRSPGDPADD